jgi:hypothetical protein
MLPVYILALERAVHMGGLVYRDSSLLALSEKGFTDVAHGIIR